MGEWVRERVKEGMIEKEKEREIGKWQTEKIKKYVFIWINREINNLKGIKTQINRYYQINQSVFKQ